jgi:hypothetical protein
MAKYRITGPNGQTYDVTAPDGVPQDQVLAHAQRYYTAKPEERAGILSGLNRPPQQGSGDGGGGDDDNIGKQIVRGLARGGAGVVSSLGDYLPSFAPSVPGRGEALRQFATAPTSGVESAAKFAGGVLPFVAQPEIGAGRALAAVAPWAGRTLPTLARMAEEGIRGGAAGAFEPTKGGSVSSHLRNVERGANWGAGTGALGSLLASPAGRRIASHIATHAQAAGLAAGMHAMGVPMHFLWSPWMGWRYLHHYSPLTTLAYKSGSALRGAGAPAGGAAAQSGQQKDNGNGDNE